MQNCQPFFLYLVSANEFLRPLILCCFFNSNFVIFKPCSSHMSCSYRFGIRLLKNDEHQVYNKYPTPPRNPGSHRNPDPDFLKGHKTHPGIQLDNFQKLDPAPSKSKISNTRWYPLKEPEFYDCMVTFNTESKMMTWRDRRCILSHFPGKCYPGLKINNNALMNSK